MNKITQPPLTLPLSNSQAPVLLEHANNNNNHILQVQNNMNNGGNYPMPNPVHSSFDKIGFEQVNLE